MSLFATLPTQVSIERQIACVKREISKREHVYPRLVASDKMRPEKAAEEIECMKAIQQTLEMVRDGNAS